MNCLPIAVDVLALGIFHRHAQCYLIFPEGGDGRPLTGTYSCNTVDHEGPSVYDRGTFELALAK